MTFPSPRLEALAAGLTSVALTLVATALVLLPQRLAQRPAAAGVLALALDADGQLRVWNRPIRANDLPVLLAQARQRDGVILRLVPETSTPWGAVQAMLTRLEASGLPVELQLP
jgi:hypothetical protein